MTLKEYCRDHHITAMSIAEDCAIPYSTVNDLLNAKTETGRTSFGVICRIADRLGLGLDEFRSMFTDDQRLDSPADPQIIVRNKRYQLVADGERIDLCRVSSLNKKNIETIAAWTLHRLNNKTSIITVLILVNYFFY